MQLIDSHAHIQQDFYGDGIFDVVQRSKKAGIIAVVSIGTSLAESQEMIGLSEKYPKYLFPTVGLHPEDARGDFKDKSFEDVSEAFAKLVKDPKVVAVGECGLDYGKDPSMVFDVEKDRQEALFRMQLNVAQAQDIPAVVHCRNAWNETFKILSDFSGLIVVLHSFTGNETVTDEAIKRGYFVSFSGIVTFKNASDIQKAAALVPLENMLLETDSPFLSPEPLRGSQNEPKNVIVTAEFIANFRRESIEAVAQITTANAQKVFGLPSDT